VLLASFLLKVPCTQGAWTDGRPYERFCYTDLVALRETHAPGPGTEPYVDRDNEYPVLTGAWMYATSLIARTDGSYLLVNALALAACAALTTVVLARLAGDRTLLFVASPSLALAAFVNWDLLPVLLSTLAIAAFLAGHDRRAGVLSGLGVAAKLYPGLIAAALIADRFATGARRAAGTLAAGTLVTTILVWGPLFVIAPQGAGLFWRSNAGRSPSPASTWGALCGPDRTGCLSDGVLAALSVSAFVAFVLVAVREKARREPAYPRWTLAFPLLVAFLLTSKVYSPQYTVWLLPLFTLIFPDVRSWVALAATDVAVHLAELSWLGGAEGFTAAPSWLLRLLVLARALALVWCFARWIRLPTTAVAPTASVATTRVAASGGG
jgi:hypothetical protein